jgi:two-component system, NarL family, nitrate/nitrite response regulator NarL
MPDKIRVAVVDDHPLFRVGVVNTLRAAGVFDVVAEGSSAEDAVRIAAEMPPDVMLLDIRMPGGGLEAARSITTSAPKVKILLLTVSEDEGDVSTGLDAGVRGYVLKGAVSSELIRMIMAVLAGELVITPTLATKLLVAVTPTQAAPPLPQDSVTSLTTRETEILGHVALGLTNKEIGLEMQLSERTVKHYMTGIMLKLNVRNRLEAAMCVPRLGPHVRSRVH